MLVVRMGVTKVEKKESQRVETTVSWKVDMRV